DGFITILNGEPIGFASWNPKILPKSAEVGHNCIVAKYKGNGYGKRQMREVVSRIIAQGAKKIVVWTNEKLIAAQRTYESVGFKFLKKSEETICPECAGQRLHYEMMIK
ncbi:MAG: GNAT family N-acetyltransferase, partial [Treponemataceae bacterium]|nr:GNAT family N-acetyltransferase [Treponemataceae bacterium]